MLDSTDPTALAATLERAARIGKTDGDAIGFNAALFVDPPLLSVIAQIPNPCEPRM